MESESNFRYIWTEWVVPLVNDIYVCKKGFLC